MDTKIGIMSTDDTQFTTLCVRPSTKERLEDLRPFDSMSWDEFVVELADRYEHAEQVDR